MNKFSFWFRKCRQALNLSQTQVASKLGINQMKVSSIENNKLEPDKSLIGRIEDLFGQFPSSDDLVINKIELNNEFSDIKRNMPEKAIEALKIYREEKNNGFCLHINKNTYITADRYQYILHQRNTQLYFAEIKYLLKYMVASEMRQSAVSSVEEIINKLDNIYEKIEEKFNNYDPANVAKELELN